MRYLTRLLAAALIITGCSTTKEPHFGGEAPTTATEAAKTAPPPAVTLDWGKPGDGKGEQGQPLQVTPLGVYYHKGHATLGRPENGVFTAIAVKVAATTGADHVPPPASNFGFSLASDDGETVTTAAGATPPWVGRVNVPNAERNIQPGRFQNYVITFDAYARGGTLTYTSPDGQLLEWQVPSKPGGQGLRRVQAALDSLGVSR
ncbi:hypothetical protein [Nonomuraea sp. NPDC005650]|uniref:hypothetical protein n=1 Tax=Nonomuraea sp. NPDC005650 TaxID=3157045 RepID=UPI0033BB4DB6